MLWATYESTFPKEKASKCDTTGRLLLVNNLSNILPKRVPLVAVLVPQSSSTAAILKALPSCYGKVTGTTKKLVSAGNHVR